MKTYTLFCKDITTKEALHEALAQLMEFPEYYGKNLDALYDVLTDITEDVELEIMDFDCLTEALGKYATSFERVLVDATKENEHLTVIQIFRDETEDEPQDETDYHFE